jgi:hypothetical protein
MLCKYIYMFHSNKESDRVNYRIFYFVIDFLHLNSMDFVVISKRAVLYQPSSVEIMPFN